MAATRYPGFDVTGAKKSWDARTREIVTARLEKKTGQPFAFLTPEEAETLKAIAGHLLFEDREELVEYVVAHFDEELSGNAGESQRKADLPPAATFVRQGLAALDAAAKRRHWRRFVHCRTGQQFELLAALQIGALEPAPEWSGIPQKELFKKLLSMAVDAYASHPRVWSEMGYAGPAYPRGYYRIELGVRDPWEPAEAGPQPSGR